MTLNGIDISRFQAGIDLNTVPCDFVIVGISDGGSVNPYADAQYQAARAAGKLRGGYHFYRNNPAEADFFAAQVQGYVGDGILILDAETDHPDLPNLCRQWLDRVHELTGVKPVLYTYWNLLYASPYRHDWSVVADGDYGLWEAQYPTSAANNGYGPVTGPPNSAPWPGLLMWQYSSSGRLPGWGGNLDLNVFYGDAGTWAAYAGSSVTAQTASVTPIQEDPMPTLDEIFDHPIDREGSAQGGTTTLRAVVANFDAWQEKQQATSQAVPGQVWAVAAQDPTDPAKEFRAIDYLVSAATRGKTNAQLLEQVTATPAAAAATVDVEALAAALAPKLTATQADQLVAAIRAQWTK